jgi:hypothetical protein
LELAAFCGYGLQRHKKPRNVKFSPSGGRALYGSPRFTTAWTQNPILARASPLLLLQKRLKSKELLWAGDASTEDSQGLSEWVKEKPPFEIGDEVLVRFT